MNKKQNRIWGQIIFILVLGFVMPYILGGFRLEAVFGDLETLEIESVLDTLSAIFAVISILLIAGYLVYRAARGEDEAVWTEWDDEGES